MTILYIISSLVTAVLSILLGLLVILNNHKGKQNRIWFLVSISIFLWTFSLAWTFLAKDASSAFFWQKVLYEGTTFIPIFFYHYCLVLTSLNNKYKKILYFGYIASFIFALSIPANLLISGVLARNEINYWPVSFSPFYYFYLCYFILFVVLSIIVLRKGYQNSKGIDKQKIKFVYYAALIGFIGGSFNFLLDFQFNYPIGNLFVSLYVVIMTYAITHYRLMDIRYIIKRSSIFVLIVVIITSIYIVLSSYLVSFLENFLESSSKIIAGFIVGIFIAIFFDPLKNFLENLTNHFLFSKKYNPKILLGEISDIISGSLDLDKILFNISKQINIAFHPSKLTFIMLDTKGKISVSNQFGFSDKEFSLFLKIVKQITNQKFQELDNIYIVSELILQNKFNSQNLRLLKKLNKISIELLVPLFVKEKLIGVLVMGEKKNNNLYSNEDLSVLKIIAHQIAVAIQNALLYEEVSELNKNLEKKVAEQTKDIKEKAEHLQKLLAMRSEFLDIASHQLRTPVTVIRGALSMILDGSITDEKKKHEFIVASFRKSSKLNDVINDILRASEMDTEKFELDLKPTDIHTLIEKIVEDKQLEAKEKKLALKLELPKEKLPMVMSDEKYMEQVIVNLINNSLQYTKKGYIKVQAELDKKYVLVRVSDTGIGIPKKDQKKLFTKFGRAQNAVETFTDGSGLGLFIIKQVMDAHKGGSVYVEKTEVGKGTTFALKIPRV